MVKLLVCGLPDVLGTSVVRYGDVPPIRLDQPAKWAGKP
jgi:hypothetical protein